MTMDWTLVLEAVATLVVAVAAYFVVSFLKSRIGAEKLAVLITWATTIVKALEQMISGSGEGAKKKKLAMDFLGEVFSDTYTEEQRSAAIESAVQQLNAAKEVK